MASREERVQDGHLAQIVYNATNRLVNEEMVAGTLRTAIRNFNAGKLDGAGALLVIAEIAALWRFLNLLEDQIRQGNEALPLDV